MANDTHYQKLMNMYRNAATNRYYNPSIRIARGTADIEIPVREDFFHSAGSVHGSVYFKLLDDAAYFAASSVVSDAHLVTASFTIYFFRPVSEGVLKASGKIVHRSTRLIVASSEVFDDQGRLVAQGSGTFMKTAIPLDAKVGYCQEKNG
jgi:uncharacterized protein (TIGR00369 family)